MREERLQELRQQSLERVAKARVLVGASIRDDARIGVTAGSRVTWEKSADGTKAMYGRLSRETTKFRTMGPSVRHTNSERFIEDESDDDPT